MGLNDSTCVLFPFWYWIWFLFFFLSSRVCTQSGLRITAVQAGVKNQLARPHYYYTTHVKGGGFCCCCAGLQLSLLKFSFDDDDDLGLIRTRVPTTATTIPTGRPIYWQSCCCGRPCARLCAVSSRRLSMLTAYKLTTTTTTGCRI